MHWFQVAVRTLLLLVAVAYAVAAPAPPGGQAAADRYLQADLEWRVGDLADHVTLGPIGAIVRAVEGATHLLDTQQCQVATVSPEGEIVDVWRARGEGPGEVNHPIGLLDLGNGVIGLANARPLFVGARSQVEGRQWSIPITGRESQTSAPIKVGMRVQSVGAFVVFDLHSTTSDNGHLVARRTLAFWPPSPGREGELDAITHVEEIDGDKLLEFSEGDRLDYWTLSRTGSVYLAPDWHAYRVDVVRPSGERSTLLTLEGYEPRRRTDSEMEAVRERYAGMARMMGGVEFETETVNRSVRLVVPRDHEAIWIIHSKTAARLEEKRVGPIHEFTSPNAPIKSIWIDGVEVHADEDLLYILDDWLYVIEGGRGLARSTPDHRLFAISAMGEMGVESPARESIAVACYRLAKTPE